LPTDQEAQESIIRLSEAVDIYDKNVEKQIASLTSKFFIEVFFTIIVPVLATGIAYFFSNSAVALAPLAVGAANVVDKLTVSKTIIATYFQDKSTLETRINSLRGNLKLSELEHDPVEQKKILDDIQRKLKEWMPY
jgi:hypothetical protein